MDFSHEGSVAFNMERFIIDLFEEFSVTKTAVNHANVNLFLIDRTADLLHKDHKYKFHTGVAKLLYLAKRVRPDILTAVAFLTTRVNNSTMNDWKKFTRVLHYVNGKNLA
jgi:hypothetical protein